jgi:hypothetical protein
MAATVTFTSGGSSIVVNTPEFGYESEVHMPIHLERAEDNTYSSWDNDNTAASDYRILSTSSWKMPVSQKAEFNQFFADSLKGRCETITMNLGATPTGFFPFLPDMGDKGIFTIRIIKRNQSGILSDPRGYFQDDISMVMVSSPSPSNDFVAEIDQGSFQIALVDGLLFPQDGFKPIADYKFSTILSRSGAPSSMDAPSLADSWSTEFDLECNTGKAQAVLSALLSTRTDDIPIYSPDGYYVYGYDKLSAGTYNSLCLGSSNTENEIIITVKHDRFDHFVIPLKFWMREMVLS